MLLDKKKRSGNENWDKLRARWVTWRAQAKATHPNSKRDKFTCCSSASLSPSTPAFLTLSLPARSHLKDIKAILTASSSVYKTTSLIPFS